MSEIYYDILQGSDEWFGLRIGSLGGDSISTAVSKGTGRRQLMFKMATELVLQKKVENTKFKYADRGSTFESPARDLFAVRNNVTIQQVAMIKDGPHKHHSPDGLFGDEDMIEIKVRLPHVFLEAKEDNPPLSTHDRKQNQWGLARWKRKRCHYIQYCPEFDELGLDPMIVKIIEPDWKEIRELERGANEFIDEMLEMVERIKNG